MKKYLLLIIFLSINSCALVLGAEDGTGTPISNHIPDYNAPENVAIKLRGTIWHLQDDKDTLYEHFIFFDRIEDKYYIMKVTHGEVPSRFPYSSEYIKFTHSGKVLSPLKSYFAGIYIEDRGFNKYFGVRLDRTGWELYLSQKDGSHAPTDIQKALDNQTASLWKLHY